MASCTYYIGRTYILSFVDKFKPLWMCQEKVLSCFSCCFHEIKFCFLTFWMVAFSDLEAEQEEPHEGCEAQTSQREAVGSLVSAVPAALKPFESIGWLDNPGHVGILEKHQGTVVSNFIYCSIDRISCVFSKVSATQKFQNNRQILLLLVH